MLSKHWEKLIDLTMGNRIGIFFIYLSSISISVSFSQEKDNIEKVFSCKVNDLVLVDVNLSFRNGMPVLYSSHLETGVCSDGLCKPVSLTVYWDLLGNFASYQTDDSYPLTKFDHIKMTKEDHEQLHKILSDTASLLRDYYVEDMIDSQRQVYSAKVDAVTRPTSATFENVTVEGALYTVYTLWHFVNGEIRERLIQYTHTLITGSFISYMLQSDNRAYIKYILEQASDAQLTPFIPKMIELIAHTDDYIPHFAIARLKNATLEDPLYQKMVAHQMSIAKRHVQNALLSRLETIPLESTAIDELVVAIDTMDAIQLEKATQILYNNRNRMSDRNYTALSALANHKNPDVARVLKGLLQKIR